MHALDEMTSLFSSKASWMREGAALNLVGQPVSPDDPTAVSWSLVGMILRLNPPFLLIAALEQVAGCDIRSIQNRFTYEGLIVLLARANQWLEDWK